MGDACGLIISGKLRESIKKDRVAFSLFKFQFREWASGAIQRLGRPFYYQIRMELVY